MMAGAARKSAIVSNSGTIGRVQASTRTEEHAGFFGEEIGAEDVGDRAGHAEDEAAEGFAIEFIAFVARELEHAKRLQRLGRQVRSRTLRGQRPSELGDDPVFPLRRSGPGRRATVAPHRRPPQRLQGFGQTRRVFAQIEPDRAEAEDLHRPADRPHEVLAKIGGAAFNQRILQNPEIGDELVGGAITGANGGVPMFGAGNGELEFAQHAKEELAIRLAGVSFCYHRAFGAFGEGIRECRPECRRKRQRPLGDRHPLQQNRKMLLVMAQACQCILGERAAGDVVGDERVAVAVPANP
jgi:hypothetical protein